MQPSRKSYFECHGVRLIFRNTVNFVAIVGRCRIATACNARSNGMGSLEKKKITAPDVVNKSSDGVWEVDQK